jgi:hypothetical protein
MPPAQARALRAYRKRLAEKGLARFEVLGRPADRALIRDVARRLAKADADAERLREALGRSLAASPPRKGDVFAMLQSAPPGFADLDFSRERDEGRDIAL